MNLSRYEDLTKNQNKGVTKLPTYWNQLNPKEKIQWIDDFLDEEAKGDYDGNTGL